MIKQHYWRDVRTDNFASKKTMKRIILIYVSTLLSVIWSGAQETRMCSDYDFSPQAFSMLTNNNVHPDLNTGTLNVSIPIYEWTDQDFKIPVNLIYSTNGFKPARQTGIVGLDWSLQIGGVISRQIVGIDDLRNNGYYYKSAHIYSDEDMYRLEQDMNYSAYHKTTMVGDHETNPDIFHFNFMNHNGSFVIDHEGNFAVYDSNGERGCYEISYNDSTSAMDFRIRTSDGYEYYFGSDEKSKEKLYAVNSVYYTAVSKDNRHLTYDNLNTISWHLSKIVAPNGCEMIFNYSSYSSYQAIPSSTLDDVSTTFGQGFFSLESPADITGGSNTISTYKHPSITTVSYLQNVQFRRPDSSSRQTVLSFEYSNKAYIETDNTDNYIYSILVTRQKKLDNIKYYNHSGDSIGETGLYYIYKDSRLLLDYLEISNVGTYSFSYNTTPNVAMPGILTNALDFWGFYNGRVDNQDNLISPTQVNNNYDEVVVHGYKNPDSEYSIIGTLKSITYPTGGRSEFEYEANTADRILLRTKVSSYVEQEIAPVVERDTSSIIGPVIVQDPYLPSLKHFNETFNFQECGGVRIKSISDYTDSTCVYKRIYSYNIPGTGKSSGIVHQFNRYYERCINGVNVYNPHIKFPDGSLDKLHMSYSYVTEHLPDSSYTIYRFTDYHIFPDEYSPHNISNGEPIPDALDYVTYINNISREPDSRHYRRGLIRGVENYNSNDELVFKREYNYEDSDQSYVAYIVGSGEKWWSARRFTCDFLLKDICETRYQGGMISTVRHFAYNDSGQKTYESITDGDGMNGQAHYYRYCYENNSLTGENLQKKVPSDIVQTRICNGDESVIRNLELSYDSNTSNANPVQVKEYYFATPVAVPSGTNSINNIVDIGRTHTNAVTTYEYDDLYRLVKVVRPGNDYISYSWDEDKYYIIGKEVNDPSNRYEYTWKDMVGLSGQVSPTGISNTFEYDSKNRLEQIKDSEGSVIRKYMYHLNNE